LRPTTIDPAGGGALDSTCESCREGGSWGKRADAQINMRGEEGRVKESCWWSRFFFFSTPKKNGIETKKKKDGNLFFLRSPGARPPLPSARGASAHDPPPFSPGSSTRTPVPRPTALTHRALEPPPGPQGARCRPKTRPRTSARPYLRPPKPPSGPVALSPPSRAAAGTPSRPRLPPAPAPGPWRASAPPHCTRRQTTSRRPYCSRRLQRDGSTLLHTWSGGGTEHRLAPADPRSSFVENGLAILSPSISRRRRPPR
jgi:hypothetical protein